MAIDRNIEEKIYAGVLGKIIGVYHGRPVEGMSYERIQAQFGDIVGYVNTDTSMPLVVPDDDISGTFGFFKSIEDFGYRRDLKAQDIGVSWLNYIIEEKTILWWGGLGRSTEHTAFLRLKAGVAAPLSGSHQLNGPWIPEQIGAQIFMDAFAMSAPNDPELAAHLVRACASVSHDGLAVDAAVFLGVMESLAFSEKSCEKLIDQGLSFVADPRLLKAIEGLRNRCATSDDWTQVRSWIAAHHSYDHYTGPCHMVPNHLIVLMAFICAGDDFNKALTIASSAGWDTDCNAGNVGCLNGIRLGLSEVSKNPELRDSVADRLYVVTSDGGSCVTDAVQETRRIITAAKRLGGDPAPASRPRFQFEYAGARQGFASCPAHPGVRAQLSCRFRPLAQAGLWLTVPPSTTSSPIAISTPTFVDRYAPDSSFAMEASPTLYSGQTVATTVTAQPNIQLRPYVLYYDLDDNTSLAYGEWRSADTQAFSWTIPPLGACPIFRFGYEIANLSATSSELSIQSIDWSHAPELFRIEGSLIKSIWNLTPFWTRAWVSSAKHFAPDFKYTLCISHPDKGGVVTTGTRDWIDYEISSALDYSIHRQGGLVIRARNHRHYMAGVICGATAKIILRHNEREIELACAAVVPPIPGNLSYLRIQAVGTCYRFFVDEKLVCEAFSDKLAGGAAGFLVDEGTLVADGFQLRALSRSS